MNQTPFRPKKYLLIPLLILTIACMCVPSGFLQSSRNYATDVPEQTETATTAPEEPTPEEPTTSPTEDTISTLTDMEQALGNTDILTEALPDGPYLILASQESLWVANQDLSSIQVLTTNAVLTQPLSTLISPDKTRIAVPVRENEGLALYVFSTAGEYPQRVDALAFSGMAAQPGDADFDAMRALTEQPIIAWAPDSDHLAAVSNLKEGKTTVDVYAMSSSEIVEIKDFDGLAFAPYWSPDAKRIVFTTVESFGTGAGYAMKGIWQADPTSGEVSLVEDAANSSGEEFLGWFDDQTTYFASWSALCGPNSIRRINMDTLDQQLIRKECYVDAAVDDNGGLLYATGEHAYLLKPDKAKPEIIADGAFTQVEWTSDFMFVIHREDAPLLTADRQGRDQQGSPETPMDDVSQYGAIWAWTDAYGEQPGVWISGMGIETRRIFSDPAFMPTWDKDNNLIFISQSQFWRATFDQMYEDVGPTVEIPGDIIDHAWMD
jgi:hypothetical protein